MNLKTLSIGFLCAICTSAPLFSQIQPGISVQITVSGVPVEEKGKIDATYPVSQNGVINMPFIGQVRAAGMRSDQLAQALQSLYKSAEIYTNPTFQVFDASTIKPEERTVVVGGNVRSTGPKPWSTTLTLWQAVQAAGGASEFGSMRRVSLMRKGNVKTYDLTKTQFQQIPLEPGDTINVPEKRWFEP